MSQKTGNGATHLRALSHSTLIRRHSPGINTLGAPPGPERGGSALLAGSLPTVVAMRVCSESYYGGNSSGFSSLATRTPVTGLSALWWVPLYPPPSLLSGLDP